MKTPMQELIEKLKSQKERQMSVMKNQLMIGTVDAVFTYAIENAESMLEKEKEVIMDAYNSGQQIPPFEYAEKYYNETFNSDTNYDRAPSEATSQSVKQ